MNNQEINKLFLKEDVNNSPKQSKVLYSSKTGISKPLNNFMGNGKLTDGVS